MTILQRLQGWKEAGAITDVQAQTISAIVRKDRFSIFFELNALLYVGVLSLVGGIGWVIQAYFANLGDAAILSGLTLLFAGCLYYCFSRAHSFSASFVESPTLAFDYVLYLGCLAFGVELGYIESHFHLLENSWDFYLLLSAVLFWVLAYRFDNRFVLSLALSTLAAWFGVRVSRFGFYSTDAVRIPGLVYGVVLALAGTGLYYRNLKKHFTETYFHMAALVMFLSLLSGVIEDKSWLYLVGVVGLAAIALVSGVRFERFAFVAYAILFSYAGISIQLLRGINLDSTAALAYFVLSGLLVVILTVAFARRFGRQE